MFNKCPRRYFVFIILASLLYFFALIFPAQNAAADIEIKEGLAIGSVGRAGRNAIHTDAIEAMIAKGQWTAPQEGVSIALPDGATRTWEKIAASDDGWLRNRGYVYATVNSDAPKVMLLEAQGHSMVYVNGEPRYGDPYRTGWEQTPVLLKAGVNEFLFSCSRGSCKASLTDPPSPAFFNLRDMTLPDFIVGEKIQAWGGVIAVNASGQPLKNLFILTAFPQENPVGVPLADMLSLSTRKVSFPMEHAALAPEGTCEIEIQLVQKEDIIPIVLDKKTVVVNIRRPDQTYKRTFFSQIDGSVQYYAVNPLNPVGGDARPALFLSLHGAGVEAVGQANAYSSKNWGYIVAPTNRRPYGFDWEDWGKFDAMEVLDLAKKSLHPDPQKIYLTGHSMGGHGTWQVGATYPSQFAAIGPSAGWISFWSYAGAAEIDSNSPIQDILRRSASASDTLALAQNYLQQGVYILHGGADDNVHVAEARSMAARLGEFHRDFVYREQPGAGHWWDASSEPGADCVDWAPMFDFFARHRLPSLEEVRCVTFITVNPGVSAWSQWVCIAAQEKALRVSSVYLRRDPGQRRIEGTTENAARLGIQLCGMAPGQPMTITLDGQTLADVAWPNGDDVLWLYKQDGKWSLGVQASAALKGPHRYGPFKLAFSHRVMFVYGTQGTPEENEWALAKARFDAEAFWYRGNGSVDIVADVDFKPEKERDRSVILYGHAESNSAWKVLLAESPVQVQRGQVRIGERVLTSDDLGCLFLQPRKDSGIALVGVVSGTGMTGLRLTNQLPYFISGAGFPDCLVIGPDALEKGVEGVRAAGFFGLDWKVDSGEFAFRD